MQAKKQEIITFFPVKTQVISRKKTIIHILRTKQYLPAYNNKLVSTSPYMHARLGI